MDLTLTSQERLDLTNLLNNSDAENTTDKIRSLKHSSAIFKDVILLQKMKKDRTNDNTDENNEELFKNKCIIECAFIYNNYTDIFNKVYNDQIDLNILARLLFVLKNIEESKLDQHEGSVIIGKLLKELYVDSALRRSEMLDEKYPPTLPRESKQIKWGEWRKKV